MAGERFALRLHSQGAAVVQSIGRRVSTTKPSGMSGSLSSSAWLQTGQGRASRAAATFARPEPWLLGVDLADPPTVVASGAEFHRELILSDHEISITGERFALILVPG